MGFNMNDHYDHNIKNQKKRFTKKSKKYLRRSFFTANICDCNYFNYNYYFYVCFIYFY